MSAEDKRVTDAVNGLVAAVETFMPILEEAEVDIDALLRPHTKYRVWRTWLYAGLPDQPYRQRGPDRQPRRKRIP